MIFWLKLYKQAFKYVLLCENMTQKYFLFWSEQIRGSYWEHLDVFTALDTNLKKMTLSIIGLKKKKEMIFRS